ncbi:UNVERIFIED_CONTAM: hypothetical protein FKN15_031033 [Acipenser sinensis]
MLMKHHHNAFMNKEERVCRSAGANEDFTEEDVMTTVCRSAGANEDFTEEDDMTTVCRSAGANEDFTEEDNMTTVCRSAGANEDFTEEDVMTTGNLGPLMEPHPPESSSDNEEETVSLAAGQEFSTDVQLTFCVMRRSCGLQDSALQEGVRTRLRIVESSGQEIPELFKDLSARLVSVHIERDCFSITFKTVEEIWKFSTYLALGHVARCLENFLFDQSFWLNEALVDDVEISVTLNQEHLATVYLGLLLQEGTFFAKALCPITNPDDDDLSIKKNDLVMVKNVGQDSFWEGMLLSSGRHDLMPVSAMQPLPYPFYQWFLKTYPGGAGSPSPGKCLFDHGIDKLVKSEFPDLKNKSQLVSPVDLNWMLSTLYYDKYLPHMSLGSLRLASDQRRSLYATLQKVDRFIQNAIRLNAQWAGDNSPLPAQITIYLKQALAIASQSGDIQAERDLCLSLVNVYQHYRVFDGAVEYAERAIETGRQINEEEAFKASLLLAWLLICNEQVEKASDILASLLKSLDETDSSTQRGVVHNLLAICLRKENRIKEAAGNLYWALKKSQETGNKRNQALTLANFGYLALSIRAYVLAEGYLLKSLQLFSELLNSSTDADHVQACLLLGQCYIETKRTEDGRLCYETALLIAMSARNLHSQLHAAKSLSCFYEKVLPRLGQCIIYYEHCVALSRQLKDKSLEGELLETLSKLYSSLKTEKSTGDADSELRLINKLTELETNLKHYDDALQYANLAVRLSVSTGDQLKERIAFHRLASVHYSLQQYEMAENYYLKALSLSPFQCVKEARYFVKVYYRLGDLTLHKLEDALDASGYFNLALAAALEELENKEALYIIYIKLAEIHASHVPDEKLHSFFMSNAQALRKEPAPDTDTFCEQYKL